MLIRAAAIRRYKSRPCQKGSVLVEAGIAFPFMLILVIGLIDISFLLNNYLSFEQAAREGVRTAGRLADLAAGTFPPSNTERHYATAANVTACNNETGTPTRQQCGHVDMQARINQIIRYENLVNVDIDNVWISSEYRPLAVPPAAVSKIDDTVAVTVWGEYDGFFLSYPISVTYRGPYLFQR